MEDQIRELKDVGFSASKLPIEESVEPAQYIFASAEMALSGNFLSLLKKKSLVYSTLHGTERGGRNFWSSVLLPNFSLSTSLIVQYPRVIAF